MMGGLHAHKSGAIGATAALAIAGLLSAVAWQVSLWQGPRDQEHYSAGRDDVLYARTATTQQENEAWTALLSSVGHATANTEGVRSFASPDDELLTYAGEAIGIQLLGQYVALKKTNRYTSEAGMRIGENTAAHMRYTPTFERYTAESLKHIVNASYENMLAYRNTLRGALAPLFDNRVSEFELFARYVETENVAFLAELGQIATRYHAAVDRAASIAVPEDAARQHARVLNALRAFALVLEDMAEHGHDPFAGAILLQTYNAVEREVFYAFDALAEYYVRTSQNL